MVQVKQKRESLEDEVRKLSEQLASKAGHMNPQQKIKVCVSTLTWTDTVSACLQAETRMLRPAELRA